MAAVAVLMTLGLVLAGCGGGSNAREVRLGYLPNITNAAALVGVEEGIFARDVPGYRVSTAKFATGTEAIAAMLSGSLDVGYMGMGPVITAASRAPGTLTVLSGASEAGAVLVVRKGSGIRSLKDLRGKRVGFPGYGNTQDLSLQWELQRVGLEGGRDGEVRTVRIRNADLRTAFERGALDAALAPEPWGSLLVDMGLAEILIPADKVMGDGRYPTVVLVVRTQFAREHPGVVRELLKANAEAIEAARDPRRVAAAFYSQVNANIPEDVLLEGIASNVPRQRVDPVGTQRLIDAANQLGYVRRPVLLRDVLPREQGDDTSATN